MPSVPIIQICKWVISLLDLQLCGFYAYDICLFWILWLLSLSFCGLFVCHACHSVSVAQNFMVPFLLHLLVFRSCVFHTLLYGLHAHHTSWFMGSVSSTHNLWVPCISLLLVNGLLCPSHMVVWIPSLAHWVCGFYASQSFVGSVLWSYNCMGSMPITFTGLWVLCLSHIIAWVRCLSRLLIMWVLCFGVIIIWDLTILWSLCLLRLPFCGFYTIVYTLLL